MHCFIGIDTSCYTTSVAILDETGKLVADQRIILSVKPGGRGLAQSEMVFQHTRNLPVIFEQVLAVLERPIKIRAVGVSGYPRPLPDSYMPAFLVGDGYARVLAATNDCAYYRISHQEGHIFAGIWSAGGPRVSEFLAVHVSGGTTELVRVVKHEHHVEIELLGESLDLNAGQFIDRIGVALGLPFPAGRHLEQLAQIGRDSAVELPVCVKDMQVSFSGPETHTRRLLASGKTSEAIAAGVELCLARTLSEWVHRALVKTGLCDVLLVGGVTANQFIRQYIYDSLAVQTGVNFHFPEKEFGPDNAVGTAYFALTR